MSAEHACCPACGAPSQPLTTGTATGQRYYRCANPKCRSEWREKPREKNPAAVAMGAMGGAARAAALTAEERRASAEQAANARWNAERQKLNFDPSKVITRPSS